MAAFTSTDLHTYKLWYNSEQILGLLTTNEKTYKNLSMTITFTIYTINLYLSNNYRYVKYILSANVICTYQGTGVYHGCRNFIISYLPTSTWPQKPTCWTTSVTCPNKLYDLKCWCCRKKTSPDLILKIISSKFFNSDNY